MICLRFGDEVELGREDRMVMDALNRLVHPETPSYSLCTCGQCSGGFISPRTARILEWIAKNVYALLTIREATKGAGSALVDNATSPVVLFMRPALVVAMGAYHVPRLAYMTVLNYIRICFSRDRSEVPTMAHICSFKPAEVSASTARAYFLVWDGKLASVMVPLLEIAARLNTMPPAGWPQDAAMYGLLVGGGASTSMRSSSQSSRQSYRQCQNVTTMSDGVTLGLNWGWQMVGNMRGRRLSPPTDDFSTPW
jgi:hypothetical protein